MTEPTCPICIEKYNKTSHFKIECHYCNYSACRECYETYILQNTISKCMNCNKEMTRENIVKNFTKKFVSTQYKTHRENCLFEQEKAMLPATQPVVEQIIENEKIRNEITKTRIEISKLYQKIRDYEDILNSTSRSKNIERKSFVRKCPNPDCRGFLSTQWKCNLCERKTCKDCNECIDADDEHKCDPNSVETAKLLAKDSKTCPNCGEMIFKIEGCDQMYCTQCHTPFSWRTGRIETGTVHNPHYYEWLQKRRRLDNQAHLDMIPRCGREIDHHFVRQMVRSPSFVFSPRIITMCRMLIHFREVILPNYETNRFDDNQDLRVMFLRNHINEAYFRITLQKREKARQKKEEFYRLFAMMIQCITEIIYRYHEERGDVKPYLDEIETLIGYVNNCLANISRIYSCQKYAISYINLAMSRA
jgi:ribosomal protein S27AE